MTDTGGVTKSVRSRSPETSTGVWNVLAEFSNEERAALHAGGTDVLVSQERRLYAVIAVR
jgi:hypothetical protein